MVDGVELTHEAADGPALVSIEVLADPRPEIGRLAHVDGRAMPVPEQIDARLTGEGVGQGDLGVVGGAAGTGELEQVVEVGHTEAAGPLQEPV